MNRIFLDQCCQTELCGMMEMLCNLSWSMIAKSQYRCLSDTWNVDTINNLILFYLNIHMWIAAIILDSVV